MVITPKQKRKAALSHAMISFRLVAMTLVLTFVFVVSCENEKSLLQSGRKAEMEIKFGRNLAKDGKLVRNGIPVEIKVLLHSPEFNTQDVTGRVAWDFEDPKLDTTFFDSSMQAYAYLYKGLGSSRRETVARLENYAATIEFEISPIEMAKVPGDTFMMGSDYVSADDDERPIHPVALSSFFMSKYEITNIEYFYFLKAMRAQDSIGPPTTTGFYANSGKIIVDDQRLGVLCLETSKSKIKNENLQHNRVDFPDHPVTGVTWWGAYLFARHYGLRLPSEAQWEYACKGKTQHNYPENDSQKLLTHAWYIANSTMPQEVGLQAWNTFKLHDMYGNVYEWCYDRYKFDYYASQSGFVAINPTGPTDVSPFFRIFRGGAYDSKITECRSTDRGSGKDVEAYPNIGFRVVRPQ